MLSKKIYKRNIVMTIHRVRGRSTEEIDRRYYNSITNALTKGVGYALQFAYPGDILEFSSSNFGYLIATIKIKVGAASLSDLSIVFDRDADHATDGV